MPTTDSEKVTRLRELMSTCYGGMDAFYFPRTDAHQNEYIREQDNYVQFLSGFSGSEAEVVVTCNKAMLWTDGRYFLQAENELENGWTLMKKGLFDSVTPEEWLLMNLPNGSRVAFDPKLVTYEMGEKFVKFLAQSGIEGFPVPKNLIESMWSNRPKQPIREIFMLNIDECGLHSKDKVKNVNEVIRAKKCHAAIFTDLQEIAWLLNIRGFDLPHTPVVFSFALLNGEEVHLFIDRQKLGGLQDSLQNVFIHDYTFATEEIHDWVSSKTSADSSFKIFLPLSVNYDLASAIGPHNSFFGPSPISMMKAIKNSVELDGMRKAHARDSIAVIEFLFWIAREVNAGTEVTEFDMLVHIDELRSKLPKFIGLSFQTISAVDDHAARPHYHMTAISGEREVTNKSICLVDSGGHYRDGTTDVTRTFTMSDEVNEQFKKMFTMVLKGHISTALLIFPRGANGMRIDMTARQYLWKEGYDFAHGVGHGVGHVLNVHEGPASLSYRSYNPHGQIHAGMILTIEPGFYFEEKWGIRIENCYEVVNATNLPSGSDNFLGFSPLTLVPIQTSLIKKDLLEEHEVEWINGYHRRCLVEHEKHLVQENKTDVLNWLENACRPI